MGVVIKLPCQVSELLTDGVGQLGGHSEVFGNGAGQGGFGNSANNGVNLLAALEDHQGRNAADAVLVGHVGVFVGVELEHLDLAVKFLGNFLDDRSHHPAGTTPGRPEIDQHRNVALEDVLVKGSVSDSSGARHQRVLIKAKSSNGLAFC